jgi:hypothetical protein
MQRYRKASHGVLRVVMQSLDKLLPVPLRQGWRGRPVESPSFDDSYVQFDRGMAEAWQARELPEPPAADSRQPISVHGAAGAWVRHVRAEILRQEGLTCSAGVASTKLLAMLATKKSKPDGGQCCVPPAGEAAFLAETQLRQLKGAGLTGLEPDVRSALAGRLGQTATCGDLPPKHVLLGWLGAERAAAVARLVERRCDGSSVGPYSVPRTISVELCVRPSNYAPCTQSAAVQQGFAALGELLHGRIAEDSEVFGVRPAHSLVAKWKAFGNRARHVQQRSVTLGEGVAATAITAGSFAARAFRLFSDAHPGGAQFSLSRLVLVLQYKDGGDGAADGNGNAAKKQRLS